MFEVQQRKMLWYQKISVNFIGFVANHVEFCIFKFSYFVVISTTAFFLGRVVAFASIFSPCQLLTSIPVVYGFVLVFMEDLGIMSHWLCECIPHITFATSQPFTFFVINRARHLNRLNTVQRQYVRCFSTCFLEKRCPSCIK